MAGNYSTRSGRVVKPSWKLRENLADIAYTAYQGLLQQQEDIHYDLKKSLQDRDPLPQVKQLYEQWKENLDELMKTQHEFAQLISTEEREKHEQSYKGHLKEYEQVRDETECFLQVYNYVFSSKGSQASSHASVSSDQEPSDSNVNKKLKEETEQLKREIAKLEKDLHITRKAVQSEKTQSKDHYQGSKLQNFFHYDFAPPRQEEDFNFERDSNLEAEEDLKPLPNYDAYNVNPYYQGYQAPPFKPKVPPSSFHLTNYAPQQPAWNPGSRSPTPPASTRVSGAGDTMTILTKLTELLQSRNDSRLPEVKPKVFKGDRLQFPLWLNSMESLIEQKAQSQGELLFFLDQYTDGEAKFCITGCLNSQAPNAYYKAKEILRNRYGDQVKIAEGYKTKLYEWPVIKRNDINGLQKLSDFLWQCYNALDTIGHLTSLDSQDENMKILRKLPNNLVERWNRIVVKWMRGDNSGDAAQWNRSRKFPPFKEFCKYIAEEARVAQGPCNVFAQQEATQKAPESAQAQGRGNFKKRTTTMNTKTSEAEKVEPSAVSRNPKPPWCPFCKGEHYISQCTQFLSQSSEKKKAYAKERGMCFGCLRRTHSYKDCRSKNPELLAEPKSSTGGGNKNKAQVKNTQVDEQGQDDFPQTDQVPICKQISRVFSTRNFNYSNVNNASMIVPVYVYHQNNVSCKVKTYCIIDTQSDSTFVSEEVANTLGLDSIPVILELITMGERSEIDSTVVNNICVQGVSESEVLTFNKAYTKDHIPGDKASIPRPDLIKTWPHLQHIADKFEPVDYDMEIGVLIGFKCVKAFIQSEQVVSDQYEPFAFHSKLGWCAFGDLSSLPESKEEGADARVTCRNFNSGTKVKEITSDQIKKVFDIGYEDTLGDTTQSSEDVRFLKIMREGLVQEEDKHFELPLPFVKDDVILPNNRSMAHSRLMGLQRKLLRDETYCQKYVAFMGKMINKGYCERVPECELLLDDGRVNYVIHMGVFHSKKIGELRIVFHFSLEFKGKSLNQFLLAGPDQINSLPGILIRFCEEEVAFTCDIEGMFSQVRVAKKHRNYLRFLWFDNNDPGAEVVEMRMGVHPFGAVSSPGCANYAFKANADIHGHNYNPEIPRFIKGGFYVDDGVKSIKDDDSAVALMMGSHNLCKDGGFNLCKFACNKQSVLDRIPRELHAQSKTDVVFNDPTTDAVDRTLGLGWDKLRDAWVFKIHRRLKSPTRRGLLSALGSIFDPLGLISPILLVGRLILQELCRMKLVWDDPIPEEILKKWDEWYSSLELLSSYSIPRCVRSPNFQAEGIELHHFSDASSQGLGTCSYVRFYNQHDPSPVRLLYSKSKVGPAKPVTIPRLELQAAMLSTQSAEFLIKELTYPIERQYFWTDSNIVLGYLRNESKRFHIFVANRVQYIKERTMVDQWQHVKTDENPGDFTSRGLLPKELIDQEMWLQGPEFLSSPGPYTLTPVEAGIADDDPEVKKPKFCLHTSSQSKISWLDQLSKVSTWGLLRKYLAIWIRYFKILQQNLQGISRGNWIRVSDLSEAETIIVREAQIVSLKKEYAILAAAKTSSTSIPKDSSLIRLDPFLDNQNVIRVGGRIRRLQVEIELVHPRIIPKDHFIAKLIIDYHHILTCHSGRNGTLNSIRNAGFWLIRSRQQVESVVRNCVDCHKLRGRPIVQKMADLPLDRLEETPPFTFVGTDFFGPFQVKEKRSLCKRWICMFFCLASSAMHLEVAHTLSTDSFLLAYRRLVARRGPVRVLRSDRGTNYVGARSELQSAMSALDNNKIHQKLLAENCDWVDFRFNFPKASHMGGTWERANRTARDNMAYLLLHHGEQLNDESLLTFVAETEATSNSRPLTYMDGVCPESGHPLAPSQLLTMKSKAVQSLPGEFEAADMYSKKYWRRVQFLSNQFWQKWRKDLLPTLNERRKWHKSTKNLQLDDIVLLIEDDTPRCNWPLARVVQVHPSDDGLVRKVTIKTKLGSYERPVHKLIYLCSAQEN